MENKKEFNSKYKVDYKMYKEFINAYQTGPIFSIILIIFILNVVAKNYMIILFLGGILITYKILGFDKLQFKRSKSLNNNEEVVQNVRIDKEIKLTSQRGNRLIDFEQIKDIVETENLLILKLNHNVGVIINKNNLTGGTKEELIDYMFSVCKKLKNKRVTNLKGWLILRKVNIIIFWVLFIISLLLVL